MTNYELVREFHRAYSIALDAAPTYDLLSLRHKLCHEEFKEAEEEWLDAVEYNYVPLNLIKELTDQLYVIYGAGASLGIDMDEAFRRVHASNMSKLDENGKPILREDGKILKGPNYFEPSFEDMV